MALTYGEISSITEKYFIPKLVDNIFSSNPLFNRMRKKQMVIQGGEKLVQPISYATTTAAGWYSGADPLTVDANDQITSAQFDWKQAYANITVTRIDELKNSGKAAIVNFVKSKVELAEKTLANTIGTALFNDGTTANQIQGLRLACNTSGTYGEIDKVANSWWRGVVDSTSTVLTASGLFQSLMGDVTVDADKPTVAICTQDAYDDLFASLQAQQRFVDAKTAEAGFTNIIVNGVPVIVDSHCPTGHLFLLNENYLKLVVHKDENFRFEPFIKPANQNVSLAKVYFAGAVVGSNCRMNAMATAIA